MWRRRWTRRCVSEPNARARRLHLQVPEQAPPAQRLGEASLRRLEHVGNVTCIANNGGMMVKEFCPMVVSVGGKFYCFTDYGSTGYTHTRKTVSQLPDEGQVASRLRASWSAVPPTYLKPFQRGPEATSSFKLGPCSFGRGSRPGLLLRVRRLLRGRSGNTGNSSSSSSMLLTASPATASASAPAAEYSPDRPGPAHSLDWSN